MFFKYLGFVFLTACGSSFVQGGVNYHQDLDTSSLNDTGGTEKQEEYEPNENQDTSSEICKTDYHPIHIEGWSKEFIAIMDGQEGVAIERSLEPAVFDGIEAYRYQDVLETYKETWFGTEIHGWDTTVYVACDYNAQQGMFILGWEGTYTSDDTWGQTQEIKATHTPPRKYLSSEYALGYEGEWSYSYTLNFEMVISGSPYDSQQSINGLYQDVGFQDITLFDGTTVEAYKVVNSFQIIAEGSQEPQKGYIEQYWVKGLGLVREIYINDNDGSEVLSKELSTYSGLEVIE